MGCNRLLVQKPADARLVDTARVQPSDAEPVAEVKHAGSVAAPTRTAVPAGEEMVAVEAHGGPEEVVGPVAPKLEAERCRHLSISRWWEVELDLGLCAPPPEKRRAADPALQRFSRRASLSSP